MPSPKAKTWERKRDGMNTLRNSAEKIPPFFMASLFLMLKETERLWCLKWNSLGGIFSGLLDQSDTQSILFFRASTSFSPSTTSDWELWSLLVFISTSSMICPSSCGEGLSQWELPLELLCLDSFCASKRIFSMSPLWMEDGEGTNSSPPFFSLPLLLFMGSSTQELLRPAGGGKDCSPSSQLLLLLCGGGSCTTETTLSGGWKSCDPAAKTVSDSRASTPRIFLKYQPIEIGYKRFSIHIRIYIWN